MNISICITTFNEEGGIAKLLDSLLNQSKKPSEIIIVDGGSTDKTVEIIKHYAKRFGVVKLLVEKSTRARGRNLSVELAKSEVIAITDAGCIAERDWLKEITEPFKNKEVDISAGFYRMIGANPMQKGMGVYLGVTPEKFGINFLPSTRSVAFTKKAWEAVGGFPEGRENSAEDTDFNYLAVRLGLKYARVKTAVVEWGMPESLKAFYFKIKEYAKWDAKYNVWWHPTHRFASHNIKAFSVLVRYAVGLGILLFSLKYALIFPILILLIFFYFVWSYKKVLQAYGDSKIAACGPILQIVSDFAVMSGFVSGILE